MNDAIGWQPELDELAERQRIARQMGGAERVARQHAAGKLTVRERIGHMLDPGSFLEIGSIAGKATYDASQRVMTDFLPANGVFGRGTVDKRPVVIFGDDFTVRGGSADASIKHKCEVRRIFESLRRQNAGYGKPPARPQRERGFGS